MDRLRKFTTGWITLFVVIVLCACPYLVRAYLVYVPLPSTDRIITALRYQPNTVGEAGFGDDGLTYTIHIIKKPEQKPTSTTRMTIWLEKRDSFNQVVEEGLMTVYIGANETLAVGRFFPMTFLDENMVRSLSSSERELVRRLLSD